MPKPKTTTVTVYETVEKKIKIHLKCPSCGASCTGKFDNVTQWSWIDVAYHGKMKRDGKHYFFDVEDNPSSKGGEQCLPIDYVCSKCGFSLEARQKLRRGTK